MANQCDNTSVGMIVRNDKDELLLIERKNEPYGFAPPAGHVDDHSSFEDAARAELEEEVGLIASELKLLIQGRKEYACRREGGDYHNWKIYAVTATDEVKRSKKETKQVGWYTALAIRELAAKTEKYNRGEISEEAWRRSPGIEPVWYEWFRELNII